MLGISIDPPLHADAMHAAAEVVMNEHLLTWYEVKAGDCFYIPTNTVHVIGGGCSIIEVQQNSDITYRLYYCGRPRELHREEGMAVANGEPYDMSRHRTLPESGDVALVDGPY